MSSDVYSVSCRVKTNIALGVCGIAKKQTWFSVWLKFVRVVRAKQGKTCAAKDPKVTDIKFRVV